MHDRGAGMGNLRAVRAAGMWTDLAFAGVWHNIGW